MKKLVLVFALVLFAIPAFAVTDLTTEITFPAITKFRVREFRVVNNSSPYVLINAEMGYSIGNTFMNIRTDRVKITNFNVFHSGQAVAAANSVGVFEGFPAAYQTNPANKVISEINDGSFGGQNKAVDYIEIIIKTLLGL